MGRRGWREKERRKKERRKKEKGEDGEGRRRRKREKVEEGEKGWRNYNPFHTHIHYLYECRDEEKRDGKFILMWTTSCKAKG